MDNFDLIKYLAKNPLLQEAITNKFAYSDGDNLVFSDEKPEDFDSIKIPNSPFLFVYANDESVDFIAAKTKDEFVNKVNDEYHGEIEGDTDEMYDEILDIANDSYISGDSNNVEVVIDNGKVVAQGGSVSGLGSTKTSAKNDPQAIFDKWVASGMRKQLVFDPGYFDKWTLNGVLPDNLKVKSGRIYIGAPIDRLPENLEIKQLALGRRADGCIIPSSAKIDQLISYAKVIFEEGCSIKTLTLERRPYNSEEISKIKDLKNLGLTTIPGLTTMPTVNGHLEVNYANDLTSLGENRSLESLQLRELPKLTELPNNLTIKGDLIIEFCPDLTIPSDIKIGGDLVFRGEEFEQGKAMVPDGIKIGGEIREKGPYDYFDRKVGIEEN